MSFHSSELEDAWDRTLTNAQEVRQSTMCLCLGCERYFAPSGAKYRPPSDLPEGIASAPLQEMTAQCPNCGQALVIGDASGFPIQNPGFITAMADYIVRMKYAQN